MLLVFKFGLRPLPMDGTYPVHYTHQELVDSKSTFSAFTNVNGEYEKKNPNKYSMSVILYIFIFGHTNIIQQQN